MANQQPTQPPRDTRTEPEKWAEDAGDAIEHLIHGYPDRQPKSDDDKQ
jgi:hypothetical protein